VRIRPISSHDYSYWSAAPTSHESARWCQGTLVVRAAQQRPSDPAVRPGRARLAPREHRALPARLVRRKCRDRRPCSRG
jgi:hypothetical protein